MQKLVTIIGAALLLGGVTAAGTFASLGSGSDSNPSISTEALTATISTNDVRREDRRQDRALEARGRANEPGEDVPGREAEPNDDRGGAADDNPGADDGSDRGSSNSGPSSSSGSSSRSGSSSDDSGHGGGGSDDGGHSGHGGGGGDDD